MLTSSSSTNYAPNEHEDVNQYDPSIMSSNSKKPYQSYPESLVNQNEIPVDLSR